MCPAIKLKTVYWLSTASRAALIPPSRRGRSSADISAISSSSAPAQWATWAAWSQLQSWSSARFWWATQISRMATARMWQRSVDGQERTAATAWQYSRSSGSGLMHWHKRKSPWHTATRGSHSSPWTVSLSVRSKPVVICSYMLKLETWFYDPQKLVDNPCTSPTSKSWPVALQIPMNTRISEQQSIYLS